MVRHIVCMGVSGTGKTTISQLLAEQLGDVDLLDGDDFHSPENRERMQQGIPLTDEDRAPWLADIRDWMTERAQAGRSTVVACSALKRRYRDLLRDAEGRVIFVHINPPDDLLRRRMAERKGHYMGLDQLDDQLRTLEPLDEDEEGLIVDNHMPPGATATEAMERLRSL